MVEKRTLRFGIMCNGTTFEAWEARCLEHLLVVDGVEPVLLIVPNRPLTTSTRLRRIASLVREKRLLWGLYHRLYVERRSSAMRPVDLVDRLGHLPTLRCRVERRGMFSEYFRDEDLAAIRAYDLDFILRFAFGIIRGEILTAARYGVWSFHHDDPEKYRGTPPAFWEIYYGDPVTGAVLQRLTDRLDGGVILHKGFFKTIDHSYVGNRDAVCFGSADWPARVCKDILYGHAAYLDGPPAPATAPVFRRPTDWQTARFVLKTVRNFLADQWCSLFRNEQWNVGVVDEPIHAFLVPRPDRRVRWLPELPRRRFLADPFGVRREGRLTLVAEEYDYRTNRGRIVALEQDDRGGFSEPKVIIELPVHMSYPCLFVHEGEVYCVPETAQAHEVELYRAREFPTRWEKVATLIENFAGVDATVFRHDGRWWLFCTDGDGGDQTKLHAWHAPALLGPWSPHAANPLKTDIRGSRPAGTPFVHEGWLYRPAQDGSQRYGGAVALNRIVRLTPTEFEEELVAVVGPDAAGPYPDGLHTLSAAGDVTVVDGCRRVFVREAFQRGVTSKLRRVLRHTVGCATTWLSPTRTWGRRREASPAGCCRSGRSPAAPE